jgi:hypothetical protein
MATIPPNESSLTRATTLALDFTGSLSVPYSVDETVIDPR